MKYYIDFEATEDKKEIISVGIVRGMEKNFILWYILMIRLLQELKR